MGKITKVTVVAILLVAVSFGIYQSRRAAEAQAQLIAAQGRSLPLTAQVEQLTQERDQANSQAAALRGEVQRLSQNAPELARLRGEMAQLRRSAQELSNQFAVTAVQGSAAGPVRESFIENQGVTAVSYDLSSLYKTLSAQDHVPQPEDSQQSRVYGSPTNGTLLIAWRKQWYPAEILETRNNQHLIRYTGYNANWDEWVSAERMATYDAHKQAAQR